MSNVNLTIGKVRFSYLNVFNPTAKEEGGDKKYSVSLLFPKKDKALIKKMQSAVDSILKDPASLTIWGGKVARDLKKCFRDGDEERDDDVYNGNMFMSASSKKRPGIVDENREAIISEDDIKSGDYGFANVTLYAYNNVSKGIGCMLNHLMKTEDGEALAGGISVEEAFKDVGGDSDDSGLL